ncbi:DEAD/DEAH box helicase [Priestia megaterium]|uniref:DEAD/DEAH box helicase n=1 Tax=Priestia megaterium TaxID=1404 RepID=UPI0020798F8E|nr:DEAD/DEAH box helicase [Priestia megaterium]USL44379.1 DEAD/DEAH box helicase [Priestia megaterium]
MNKELSDKIWKKEEFIKDYELLLSEGFKKSFSLFKEDSQLSLLSLKRLLESATIFSTTEEKEYKEAAYKIAINSLLLFKDNLENLHELIEFIMLRLGNFPAIDLMSKKGLKSDAHDKTLPFLSVVESIQKTQENTLQIKDNSFKLTDFQKELWGYLGLGLTVSLSAPTSAGKSFILQNFIMDKLITNNRFNAIYVVPSRALITQVSNTLMKSMKDNNLTNVSISTVPNISKDNHYEKEVYVLTQERLQILLKDHPEKVFDLVIVDESQLISDDDRGVILQFVLENLLNIHKETQIIFASPLTENPQLLPKIFGIEKFKSIKEEESSVSQNLIFLNVENNQIQLETQINQNKVLLGTETLSFNDREASLLSKIAVQFGMGHNNLVYAGGQAKSELIAKEISNLLTEETEDETILHFIDFIKDYIHEEYELVHSLKKGVAFHYGNIPAIIRSTIEDLYSQGKLKYLVSTSTLLHGINLPIQNLFLENPTKGSKNTSEGRKDIPIAPLEFWNLAGRAGRMGIDFQGNVFIINIKDWIENPLNNQLDKNVEIKPAFQRHLVEDSSQLISFIKDKGHTSGNPDSQGLETTFVKLYTHFLSDTLNQTFDNLDSPVSETVRNDISSALKEMYKELEIPGSLVRNNISISPYRQEQMLQYLIKKIDKEGPTKFIPLHPLRDWKEVYDNYLWTFKRIHTNLQKIPGKDRSHFYFAPLAIRWMRGESFSGLIQDAYDFKNKNMKGTPNISTVIREVMSNIEKQLRFRYVKYFSCYLDILKFALDQTGNSSWKENIPNISLYLELGASSRTMISFMELGLSRATASILTIVVKNNNLNTEDVKKWLSKVDLEKLSLPLVCKEEIINLFIYNKLTRP